MPNLIQIADQLKGAPDAFLAQESQSPSGYAPPYLVMGEMQRRQALRQKSAQPAPTTTVMQDLTASMPQAMPPGMMSGMPQMQGLAAMMPQPLRMAVGGLASRYPMLPSGSWMYNSGYLPSTEGPAPPDTLNNKMERVPGGYTIGGVFFPDMPSFRPYEYKAPDPIKVEEPELAPLVDQARALRQTPTTDFASRIGELEEERKKMKRPGLGEFFLQSGLGTLASRAPNSMQAFGEGGLGALRDVREQQRYADEQRRNIGAQIMSTRMAQSQEARQRENADIETAMQLQARLHGARVTEAQGLMSQRAQQEAANLASYRESQDYLQKQHQFETQLATAGLAQKAQISPFDPRYMDKAREQAEIDLDKAKKLATYQEGLYRARHPGTGTSGGLTAALKQEMQNAKLGNRAGSLIEEQLPYAYNSLRKDPSYMTKEGKPSFTAEDVYGLAKQYALGNVTAKDEKAGQFKNYKDDHPLLREMVTDRLRTYTPPRDDKYFERLEGTLERWGKTGKDVKAGTSGGGLSEGIKDVADEIQKPQANDLRFQPARPGEPWIGQAPAGTATTVTPQGPVTTTTGQNWVITSDDLDKHKKGSRTSAPTQPTVPQPTPPPPPLIPPPPPPPPTPTRQGPVPTAGLGSLGSISLPPPPPAAPAAPDPRVRTAYIGSGGSNLPASVSGSYLPPGPGEVLQDVANAAGVVGSGARWAGQKAASGAGQAFDSLRGIPGASGATIAQVAEPMNPRMQPGENYAQYQARLAMLNQLRGR